MPFPFAYVCDLLQSLDGQQLQSGRKSNPEMIRLWFQKHRALIDGGTDGPALLSTLLPEKRTDRVFQVQAAGLERIIGRALGLGESRMRELARYQTPGLGIDLGDCVEYILTATPNPLYNGASGVTVEEIDDVIAGVAASCRFSSPEVRSSKPRLKRTDAFGNIYCRLEAREAKWFTRLILKDFSPVVLEAQVIYRYYHPLLPQIMRIRDSFNVAINLLRTQSAKDRPAGALQGDSDLVPVLKPQLGVKVGRQPWFKARSIKHCMDMGSGRMSCEEKIDGEYCQIHIDLSKGPRCIQIFSKSGKDSTQDRLGVHRAILDSLDIGKPACRIEKGCILEGELVVYSDKHRRVLPFHKIRKHVTRSGLYIGTASDSQPHEHEHLMIYYYDVLLIDDESLLSVRHSERFRRLARLINTRQGHAELVNRLVIDFSHSSAASMLRKEFAACIKRGGEGLVLKPDDRYFDFSESRKDFSCVNIKMKKEYIGQFGDVGDFAAVGAHYDAKSAKAYRMSNVRWTHFFVGCLDNPAEARAGQEKPSFTVTNIVELSEVQLKSLLTFAHVDAVDPEHNDAINIRLEPGISRGMKLSTVFRNPPVFDLRCFSFDMESNSRFWSLRFPTVSKVHFDRTYLDAISFAELQDMAEKAKAEPLPDGSQELAEWIRALEKADPRGVAVDATSQQSKITAATPPPPRSGSYNQTTPSCLSDAAPSTINRSNNALPTLTPPTSSDFEPQLPGSENAVVAHGRQKGQVLGKRSRVEEASPRQGGPPSPVKRSRTELSSSVEKCTCHCHNRKRTRSI